MVAMSATPADARDKIRPGQEQREGWDGQQADMSQCDEERKLGHFCSIDLPGSRS